MNSEPTSRRFQFSIASLLVLQVLVSLTFGIGKGFGWPVAVGIALLTTMFTLTVVGTVWIAGEWGRSVRTARVVAKAIVWVAVVSLVVTALALFGARLF